MLEHPFGGNFGVILGGLGDSGALSGSWALPELFQGASGAPPGRSGVFLGVQDGALGAFSWAESTLKAVQEASKMDPKTIHLSEGRRNAKMEAEWEQGTPK